VRGFVHSYSLVRKLMAEGPEASIEDCVREVQIFPETKPLDDLLADLQRVRSSLAIVIDEYGRTAGIVTVEDIVEEVVGEIVDEYDKETPPVEHLNDGSCRVTARLPIEDLEEMYDVELPKEDVETVGGLLATQLGRVPIPGATVEVGGLVLVAESAQGRRKQIGTVLVRRTEEEPTRDRQ
jgi:CBS domain containing-hemolysin-like protein